MANCKGPSVARPVAKGEKTSMKIYTKRGDDGSTGLYGSPTRVAKNDLRVSVYGEVDELNAVLGLCRAVWQERAAHTAPPGSVDLDVVLARLQDELFRLGSELATPEGVMPPPHLALIAIVDSERMEREIDALELELAPLKSFILPGGSQGAAHLHVARVVCRRAERRLVEFAARTTLRAEVLTYVNRLSDLLFTMARAANHRLGAEETKWEPRKQA